MSTPEQLIQEDQDTFQPIAVPVWITAADLAQVAGIAEQNARLALSKCATGGTWRKHTLKVRTKDGGPANAQNPYQVHIESLPPALVAAYYKQHTRTTLPVKVQTGPVLPMPTTLDPRAARRRSEARWKLEILLPALQFAKGSRARGQALRDIARIKHLDLSGKRRTISERTLQEWLQKLETTGEATILARRDREDRPDRNIICRAWDKACPLPPETQAAIATELRRYVRGLWAEMPGWSAIEQLASSKLLELCCAHGWKEATYLACRVGRHYVEKHSATRILATKHKDAKRWSDEFTPRIKRTREGMRPGDLVVGDVHPVDVIMRRSDGSEATPRLIGWYDLATGDLFCSLVLLDKGRGITQAHIAASFAAMVEAWGLPKALLLDNGSEYSWDELEAGFAALSSLARGFNFMIRDDDEATPILEENDEGRETPIIRAMPYRASSKPIEGIFAVLERNLLRAFPGWIGGDRMNKRTHKVGEASRPFPGTIDDFEATFYEALRFWRSIERPALGGRSIDQVRDAFQRDGGPLPPAVERSALVAALSETVKRKVTTWGVEIDGQWYRSDALISNTGQTMVFRYAKWAPEYVFYIGAGKALVKVPLAPVFNYTDGEGARHQADLTKIQNQWTRQLKASATKVDVLAEMSRHTNSVGNHVPVLKGPAIALSEELKSAVDAVNLPESENESRHLGYGDVLDQKTGEIVCTIPDHYTARHQPAEEDDEPDWEEVAKRFAQKEGLDEVPPSSSPDVASRPNGTHK
tara:strand:+ start:12825 stop:15098 length:2274 start_codon:yes stop_codon:yes gene_type:complete